MYRYYSLLSFFFFNFHSITRIIVVENARIWNLWRFSSWMLSKWFDGILWNNVTDEQKRQFFFWMEVSICWDVNTFAWLECVCDWPGGASFFFIINGLSGYRRPQVEHFKEGQFTLIASWPVLTTTTFTNLGDLLNYIAVEVWVYPALVRPYSTTRDLKSSVSTSFLRICDRKHHSNRKGSISKTLFQLRPPFLR